MAPNLDLVGWAEHPRDDLKFARKHCFCSKDLSQHGPRFRPGQVDFREFVGTVCQFDLLAHQEVVEVLEQSVG